MIAAILEYWHLFHCVTTIKISTISYQNVASRGEEHFNACMIHI